VALASGVSTATVSYVVNNGPRRVDSGTRRRVLAAVEQLQYHPNTMARGLHRKRLNCLGVVFPQPYPGLVSDSYFSGILDGIIRIATERRQDVTLYTSLDYDSQKHYRTFRDRRVDGLLLIATLTDSGIVPALLGVGMPFVLINGASTQPGVQAVDVDNIDAVQRLVDHLASLGHSRIALLGGQSNSPSTAPRRAGYFSAMNSLGFPVEPDFVIEGSYEEEWGIAGMKRLLALSKPPTAVIAGGDSIAVGAMKTCEAAGISVPQLMSIVGFDDAPYAAHANPPLTTMRHPLPELGAAAASLLLDRLDSDQDLDKAVENNQPVMMRAQLVTRQSTGPARATTALPAQTINTENLND
jgi:DNA-binding LacI/PurR family transcriptional regulator